MILFCIGLTGASFAQDSAKVNLTKIISSVNTFTSNLAIEKLYLQTDKPSYVSEDTLWFKAYLFDASYLNAATKSGMLYLEIANDSNRVMKRIRVPVFAGIAMGQVALDQNELPQGSYILRAYTNWMRNFGEDYIVKKYFYIGEVSDKDWLVNYQAQLVKDADQDKVQLGLRLKQFDEFPVGLREMRIRITDEKRTWFKSDIETNVDGWLAINFTLPEKANVKDLTLSMQDMRKSEGNRKLQMPVLLNRPERMDLQFMPEGGNLVAGLPAHIAFKAINEDGMAADLSAKVYTSTLQEVAEFRSTHKGMGTFNFTPQAGERYSAKVKLPNGLYQSYALPVIKNTGTVLKINNELNSDSCEIIINSTPDIAAAGNTYFLIGQARGVACYGASFNFSKGAVKLMVSKDIFPSGIVRFTVIGPDNKALNERIVFIDHDDNLNIRITSDKALYGQRDRVALNIQVTDKNGAPVQGSFSLAVTDDGQVRTDSIKDGSILTQMLLTSDLKGEIEDPGYYSRSSLSAKKWQDLDQLLLTQGWVGYDWDDIFSPPKSFIYPPEPEFLIQGKVTNMFNKPVANSQVSLLSKKPFLVLDTLTDDQGIFTFKSIVPVDTAVFFIQSRNKKGKSFNVGIEMDEFKPPVFSAISKRMIPWYVNMDTSSFELVNRQVQLKKEQERVTSGILLKEVVIKAKKIIKDSKNLNGAGEADIIVDEQELEKAGKTTLGDLLEKRVKGFGLRMTRTGEKIYKINDLMVHLIIDGTDTEFFKPEGIPLDQYFKQYFDYYDAEEIKGIEVMKSSKYAINYWSEFLSPFTNFYDHAFIEVTTRGGKGPFVKKSVGTYLFKPMPFVLPKEFYVPKYNAHSTVDMTDIRSTIYWNPDIITNAEGMATVSFYTADNPGSYSLQLEGSDMKGNMGVKRATIKTRRTPQL